MLYYRRSYKWIEVLNIPNLGWRVGILYAKTVFLARIPVFAGIPGPVDKKLDPHFEIPVPKFYRFLDLKAPLSKYANVFVWFSNWPL